MEVQLTFKGVGASDDRSLLHARRTPLWCSIVLDVRDTLCRRGRTPATVFAHVVPRISKEIVDLPSDRRGITEFGLIVSLDRNVLFDPLRLAGDLTAETEQMLNRFPLYLLGTRPITTIVPGSIKFEAGRMSAEFQSGGTSAEAIVACTWPESRIKPDHRIDCPSPHNVLRVFEESGALLLRRNASSLLAEAMAYVESPERRMPFDLQFLDLGVQYIGKSYGREGSRGAFARLKSHRTFQRVLAELSVESEAWLMLLDSTTHDKITSTVPLSEVGERPDALHVDRVVRGLSEDEQLVDLVEGSLIRHFQPPYNVQLKKDFPVASAKSVSGPLAQHVNLVGVEIETERLGLRLFSKIVSPAFEHRPRFHLQSQAEREGMFDFADDVTTGQFDGGGPLAQ